jgi:hypothetical protein
MEEEKRRVEEEKRRVEEEKRRIEEEKYRAETENREMEAKNREMEAKNREMESEKWQIEAEKRQMEARIKDERRDREPESQRRGMEEKITMHGDRREMELKLRETLREKHGELVESRLQRRLRMAAAGEAGGREEAAFLANSHVDKVYKDQGLEDEDAEDVFSALPPPTLFVGAKVGRAGKDGDEEERIPNGDAVENAQFRIDNAKSRVEQERSDSRFRGESIYESLKNSTSKTKTSGSKTKTSASKAKAVTSLDIGNVAGYGSQSNRDLGKRGKDRERERGSLSEGTDGLKRLLETKRKYESYLVKQGNGGFLAK